MGNIKGGRSARLRSFISLVGSGAGLAPRRGSVAAPGARQLAALGALVLAFSAGCGAPPLAANSSLEAPTTRPLPLVRVRFYETGVALFERAGKLDGTSSLPVPAAHVDDALKTLVVLGSGKGAEFRGVELESVLSDGLARSLAGLPQGEGDPLDYGKLLASLRGVEVEASNARERIVGRLVQVTAQAAAPSPAPTPGPAPKEAVAQTPQQRDDYLLVFLAKDGGVHRWAASELRSLRPTDPAVVKRLDGAARVLADRSAQLRHDLRLLGRGESVRVAYLREAPLFRTTYRAVLAPDGKHAALRGWALVHNDTDEDWRGVAVELVNGRPGSFIYPLSAPRYARRELVHPEEQLSTVPQLARKTPDQLWGDNVESDEVTLSGSGSAYGMGMGGVGHGYGGSARGMASRHTSVGASSAISAGDLAATAAAATSRSPALFSYRLGEPTDLRAHGSALLPFAASEFGALRFTRFSEAGADGKTVLLVEHKGRETLPTGPIAVFEPDGFIGEALLPRLLPGDRSFLELGVDLDIKLERNTADEPEATAAYQRITLEHDALAFHYLQRSTLLFMASNRSTLPRAVAVRVPVVRNAQVTGAVRLDYDLATSEALAFFDVGAGKDEKVKLQATEGLQRRVLFSRLDTGTLDNVLANGTALPAPTRAALEQAKKRLVPIEKQEGDRKAVDERHDAVEKELKRARSQVEALGAKAGAEARPLIGTVSTREQELTTLEQRLRALDEEIRKAREELKKELTAALFPKTPSK